MEEDINEIIVNDDITDSIDLNTVLNEIYEEVFKPYNDGSDIFENHISGLTQNKISKFFINIMTK